MKRTVSDFPPFPPSVLSVFSGVNLFAPANQEYTGAQQPECHRRWLGNDQNRETLKPRQRAWRHQATSGDHFRHHR